MSNYSDNTLVEDDNHAWTILMNMLPEKSKVLDIGCSSGNFGKELIDKKGCIVDGIELDEEDFVKAKKKLRNVWNINIEEDSLADIKDIYDAVVLADVIEHLVHPAQALKRIKDLIKPNGAVIFSIPNMAHISVRLSILEGNFTYTETGLLDKTHLHYYDSDEVQRVFKEAGMALEKIDYPQVRYPKTLVEKKLNKLGLKPTKEFYDKLDQPSYYAYQFIGKAKYTNKKDLTDAQIPKKQAIQNDFLTLSDEIEARKLHEQALETDLQKSRAEAKYVSDMLQRVLESKSYKIVRKTAQIVHSADKLKPKRR